MIIKAPAIALTTTAPATKLDIKFDNDLTLIECKPKMTGEDFSFMLNKVPGAIVWLGVGNDSNRDLSIFRHDDIHQFQT